MGSEKLNEEKGHIKIEWIPGELLKFEGIVTKEEIDSILYNAPKHNLMIFREIEELTNKTGRISDRLMVISELYKLKEDLDE